MKIKDIIKISACFLGLEDVISYLESDGEDNLSEGAVNKVSVMTTLANLVIDELSATYIPMYKTEQIKTGSTRLNFDALSENILAIKQVLNVQGEPLQYTLHSNFVTFPSSAYVIEYSYIPSNYGLTDIVGYLECQVPSRVIAYGLSAEYCLTERRFDEAVLWHKRYSDAVKELCVPKNKVVKKRSWI